MRCPQCGVEAPPADRCLCGHQFTCADAPPQKTSARAWVVRGGFVLFVLSILSLLIVIFRFHPPTPTPAPRAAAVRNDTDKVWNYGPKKTSGAMTLRGTYWCGETFDDAARIGIAVNRSDTAALAGLLARGNAFQVEKGTRVVSGGIVDMGISLVIINSGFQSGRKCYISTNALN